MSHHEKVMALGYRDDLMQVKKHAVTLTFNIRGFLNRQQRLKEKVIQIGYAH